MSGERRFLAMQRAALFGAAAAAFAAVAVSGALPRPAELAFTVAWCLGLAVRERASRRLANAVNLATVGLTLSLLLPAFAHREQLPIAAAETALALCANRLLVRRGAADDGMLHLSCWLLLASGAALTGELLYGLCLLAYAALAATSMLLAELRRGIEEETPEQARALLSAPELTSPRLLGYAASLGVFAAAFGAALFPVFPRVQAGFWRGLGGGQPTTGLSDRVDLSAEGRIADSPRVVLQAELQGNRAAARYWRALTLERYTGQGWTRVESPTRALRGVSRAGTPVLSGAFDLFSDATHAVPVPEGVVRLWPDPPAIRLRESATGDLQLGFAAPDHEAFSVEAALEPSREPGRDEVARALELPELSPAVRELARALVPDGTGPAEAVRRVAAHFAGFTYSRELHRSATPLDDFLTRRTGHCELFATAVAVLLRARGVPARYVAGYYASDPTGDPLTLRDWDAHAWVEALVPGQGFVPVDATPPELRGGRLEHAGPWQRLLDLWDSVQLRWLHGVVDFDSRSQARTAGALARGIERGVDTLLHRSRRRVLALLGLLGLLAFAARRWPRSRDPALRLERTLFAVLEGRGLARVRSETYEEALGKVRGIDAALAAATEPLLARLGAARFGGRPLQPGEPAALRARIARLRAVNYTGS